MFHRLIAEYNGLKPNRVCLIHCAWPIDGGSAGRNQEGICSECKWSGLASLELSVDSTPKSTMYGQSLSLKLVIVSRAGASPQQVDASYDRCGSHCSCRDRNPLEMSSNHEVRESMVHKALYSDFF